MSMNKLPVARNDATKVLRPGTVDPAIDDDMADLLLSQLLGNRWKAHQCVDFLLCEQPCRFTNRMRDKVDLPFRIQAHVGCHACNEIMVFCTQREHPHCLSLEGAN